MTLLVVDDQVDNLKTMSEMLQPLYQVCATSSGEQALRLAAAEPRPDLVLLDVMMPVMNGYAVLTQIRENPETRDIPVIFITGLAGEEDEKYGLDLGAVDYINKPINHSILLARVRTHLILAEQYKLSKLLNANLDIQVQERTATLQETLTSLATAHDRLKNSLLSTAHLISNLLETREKAMAGHSRRVAASAHKLASFFKLSEAARQTILLAGLVHDIGKIGLPDALFGKPFEVLTAEERQEMIRHPERGVELLKGLEPFHEASKLVRWHHEYFDGSGYPDRLRGEDIPIGARILVVTNDYDALLCGTLISRKLDRSGAMDFLMANTKRRYDPLVLDAFFKLKCGVQVLRDQPEASDTEARDSRRASKPLQGIARSLPVSDLKPGMVLLKSISLPGGVLLLSRGYALTQGIIDQLLDIQGRLGRPFPPMDVVIRVTSQ